MLIGANISWRLIAHLQEYFDVLTHVNQTQLASPAKDATIWQYATENHFHILTPDEDFRTLASVKGFPPKVVLLTVSNLRTSALAQCIISNHKVIKTFLENTEEGLLEINYYVAL